MLYTNPTRSKPPWMNGPHRAPGGIGSGGCFETESNDLSGNGETGVSAEYDELKRQVLASFVSHVATATIPARRNSSRSAEATEAWGARRMTRPWLHGRPGPLLRRLAARRTVPGRPCGICK